MTVKLAPVWKDALTLLSGRIVAAQLGLVALVFGFFLLWLRVPDASVPEVAGSALLALLIVVVASLGESRLMLHLGRRPFTLARLVRGSAFSSRRCRPMVSLECVRRPHERA